MRFHLLALPNVQTTSAYSLDGFCTATINFAKVLKHLGHAVFLYASEENEAPCDELITCITKEEQQTLLGDGQYQYAAMEGNYPLWALQIPRINKALSERKQPRDFIAIIGGASHKPIADAHPDLISFEYLIGYVSSFAKYRVFASHYWRGVTHGFSDEWDGRFFDDVIHGLYDTSQFVPSFEKQPYAAYVGRLTPKKGLEIACLACEAAGIPLKVVGHGDKGLVTHGAEYLGALDDKARNEVVANAQCLLCPTTYIEPLGNVAIEAQLLGTPPISTDFGGFVETITDGYNGFRCKDLGEFVRAIKLSSQMDYQYIADEAHEYHSIAAKARRYQSYFERLNTLWDKGFYTV